MASQTGGTKPVGQTSRKNSGDFGKRLENIRPASAPVKNNSPTDGKQNGKTLEDRCEKAKLMRDRHAEDRKRKNEERKAAVEDRRRQKEMQESAKNTALRNNPTQTKSATKTSGRKLPNLPKEVKPQTSLGSPSSGDSPVHSPPGPGGNPLAARRGLTGPTSASTSCLSNVGSGGKGHLGAPKKASSSTSNLAQQPGGKLKAKSVATRNVEKASIPKAQSTGAIHQVGANAKSRPKSGTAKKAKSPPVHHAGTSNEQEAKLALAEHRRKAREEAERKALLDKERQEVLRKQREEEQQRLAEENAKEMARQEQLAEQLKKQEEERRAKLQEQKIKDELERKEREEAEVKRKEEMEVLRKQELERRAKEAEKREKEEEERLEREEIERQERRKRVEMIMSRTRMTSGSNNNNVPKEMIDSLHNSSATVSEILQKVKEKSARGSPIPGQDSDIWFDAEENNMNGNNVVTSGRLSDTQGSDTTDGQNSAKSGVGESRGGDHIWRNVEDVMVTSETQVRQALERKGIMGEDEDDEDGEEGQLWKVVEGKRQISEVV